MSKKVTLTFAAVLLILVGYMLGTHFFSPERIVVFENPAEQTDHGFAVVPASMPMGKSDNPSLQSLNEAFVSIADNVTESVVTIMVEKVVKNRNTSPFPGWDEDMFRRFFGPMPEYRRGDALGSGVIVDSDGYILTNNHVVENGEKIKVKLMDDRTFKAEIVGTDPRTDVAVIKIDAKNLHPAVLGDSEALRVGEWVMAIGSPFSENLAHTVTAGIVSAKGRSNIVDVPIEQFIQTDAAINPGNSGGALVNINGELVGINTAIATNGSAGGNLGIGFAIPINLAKKVMKDLIEEGRVIRAWLGVRIERIDDNFAKAMGIDVRQGALIIEIVEGSPAEKAGLKVGDLIIEYEGKKVKDPSHLSSLVSNSEVGKNSELVIIREKKEKTLRVKLQEMPEDIDSRPTTQASSNNELGVRVQDINRDLAQEFDIDPDEEGVLITYVERGSEAARSLRPGDIIKRVGYKDVSSVAEYEKALESSDSEVVMFLVKRARNTFFVTLEKTG